MRGRKAVAPPNGRRGNRESLLIQEPYHPDPPHYLAVSQYFHSKPFGDAHEYEGEHDGDDDAASKVLQQAIPPSAIPGSSSLAIPKNLLPVVVVVFVVGGDRGGITFRGTSTGVTVLAISLLDMEAAIDAELEDDSTVTKFVVIVSALLPLAS